MAAPRLRICAPTRSQVQPHAGQLRADARGLWQVAGGWTAAACDRRFALTTLSSTAHGHMVQWKETFFFGGKPAQLGLGLGLA